jgi:ribosomal-protein-alanine acetyltransferase
MNLRLATPADLPQLVAISNSAGSAAHWSPQQWLDIFHSQIPARLAWVAEQPERRRLPRTRLRSSFEGEEGEQEAPDLGMHSPPAAGFLVAQCGSPEWELENIAVLPAFRRHGVGAALLSALLEQARARRAERILLEVRASNQSAICLYTQAGFQLLARRQGYYQNPAEDALLFGHSL